MKIHIKSLKFETTYLLNKHFIRSKNVQSKYKLVRLNI